MVARFLVNFTLNLVIYQNNSLAMSESAVDIDRIDLNPSSSLRDCALLKARSTGPPPRASRGPGFTQYASTRRPSGRWKAC
jgi:hypothetical protein